jgi:phosphomannomutase
MKKVIAFDLDGTLAPSKSSLPDRMSDALSGLLDHFEVCVISGGKFGQFQSQLLDNLKASPEQLERLHLMPTCGTQYYHYDVAKKEWKRVYAELIDEADKKRIADALERGFEELGYKAAKTYGPAVEDRESQITYSVLGQDIVSELGEAGIDKAYGMDKLMELLQVGKDDLLFIGDRLQEGGNDYPVKAMGIDSLEVSRWEDTALVIEGILHTI